MIKKILYLDFDGTLTKHGGQYVFNHISDGGTDKTCVDRKKCYGSLLPGVLEFIRFALQHPLIELHIASNNYLWYIKGILTNANLKDPLTNQEFKQIKIHHRDFPITKDNHMLKQHKYSPNTMHFVFDDCKHDVKKYRKIANKHNINMKLFHVETGKSDWKKNLTWLKSIIAEYQLTSVTAYDKTVEFLLRDIAVDVDSVDDNGNSALEIAFSLNHEKVYLPS